MSYRGCKKGGCARGRIRASRVFVAGSGFGGESCGWERAGRNGASWPGDSFSSSTRHIRSGSSRVRRRAGNKPGVGARGWKLRGPTSAMRIQPIPQQQPRPVQFGVQMTQEGDDLLGVDVGVGMEAEIKPAPAAAQTQDGDHGDL